MMGKLFEKVLSEDENDCSEENLLDEVKEGIKEEVEGENREVKEVISKKRRFTLKQVLLLLILLFLVFAPRLYVLFFVTDPQNAGVGWYGDTYHHWQIAYLSKEIGFKQGFLRLWDLKGMEYFWGLLHPLILAILISLTGSTSIVLTRLFSMICGGISVVLLFYLAKRYWGPRVAWGAMLLAALNPVALFNDVSGMVEPLAIVFLLTGLLVLQKNPLVAGLMWGLASLARGEAWLFAIGLIGATLLFYRSKNHSRELTAVGYILIIGPYMKYLLDKTGNAIYPLWWNFLGNAAGRWQADISLRPDQEIARIIFVAMFLISILGIVLTIWKKPRGWLLYLLGLGNFFFLGGFVGLTDYSKSYVHYFWVVRIFILPYMILGVFLAVLFLKVIPEFLGFLKKVKLGWLPVLGGWLAVLAILAVSQLSWKVIWHYYQRTIPIWEKEMKLTKQASDYYQSGKLLIPEYDPQFTYGLVYFGNIKGENLVGEMFDPFYYMEDKPFDNWGENREIIYNWLKKENIQLLITGKNKETYHALIQREPAWFEYLDKNDDFNLEFYRVKP